MVKSPIKLGPIVLGYEEKLSIEGMEKLKAAESLSKCKDCSRVVGGGGGGGSHNQAEPTPLPKHSVVTWELKKIRDPQIYTPK